MNHIHTILFEKHEIPLRGRNLILTGNNGSGKTYFLNKIRNYLAHDKVDLNTNQKKEEYDKLIELLEYTLEKFQQSLKLDKDHIKLIHKIINEKNISNTSSIQTLNNILINKYNKFLQEKEDFFKENPRLNQQD